MDIKKALSALEKHVSEHSNNKYQNSVIDSEPSLKVPQFTLLTAVKYITRYLAKSGEKRMQTIDLLKACHFILFEVQNQLDKESIYPRFPEGGIYGAVPDVQLLKSEGFVGILETLRKQHEQIPRPLIDSKVGTIKDLMDKLHPQAQEAVIEWFQQKFNLRRPLPTIEQVAWHGEGFRGLKKEPLLPGKWKSKKKKTKVTRKAKRKK